MNINKLNTKVSSKCKVYTLLLKYIFNILILLYILIYKVLCKVYTYVKFSNISISYTKKSVKKECKVLYTFHQN